MPNDKTINSTASILNSLPNSNSKPTQLNSTLNAADEPECHPSGWNANSNWDPLHFDHLAEAYSLQSAQSTKNGIVQRTSPQPDQTPTESNASCDAYFEPSAHLQKEAGAIAINGCRLS